MIGKTISHYRIIEKLGEGGMGVVYKAEDTKLKRLVALKFLPSSIMASEAEKTRFIHEAQAAAALNHPNICTIYEINEIDGQAFIAMEFVEGQSLKEKIEAGPLKLDEALNIAMQAAEGLQAAHEKKITHRDIKPANIMLTPKGQVKIMDFGLAKLTGRSALTKEGATLGTVAYMSPQQARGEEVDHRSDIWSFGVVLYEMITGQLPFKGEYDQAVVYLILNVEPEPMIPTGSGRTGVPMELERIVNNAMVKKTGERYQHVDELLVDLKTLGKRLEFGGATERTQIKKSAPFPHAKVKPQSLAMMIGAAILIAGMVAALFMVDWKRSSNLHPNRLVVAVFENQTGDPSLDPIGRMAADWITQGLAQTGLVEIVPSLSALPASDEAGAASGTRTAIAFVRALANATGAGKVIFGTYYRQGESIQFQAQIMDAQHEKLLSAITPVSGSLKTPLEAIERLRQNVMGAVATYVDSRIGEGTYIAGHQPPNFEAYQEFIEGMQLFVRREFAEAARHFERAYAFDTTFASPLRVAADAYINLGRYAQTDSVVRILNQSRERLIPLERYWLDRLQASLRGDNTGALLAMRRVVEIAPGWDVGLYVLGYSALRVNRPQETVNALAQYDFERGLMKAGFGSYDFFTRAYHVLRNHRKELEVAQRSRHYYPERFSTLFYETRALAALGRVQEINQRLDESLALPPERGWTAGSVMRLTAGELREHDHRQAAFDVVARAINWYKNRPAEEAATPAHRYALARALYLAERWEEAQALMEKLTAEDSSNIDYQGYLGAIAARRGEPDKARRIAAQLQQLKRPYLFGRHTYWCACIAALLEEREQAVALLREAFAQGQAYGTEILSDMNLESLRDYPPFKELLRPKG